MLLFFLWVDFTYIIKQQTTARIIVVHPSLNFYWSWSFVYFKYNVCSTVPPNADGVYLSDTSGRLVEGQDVNLNESQSYTFTCDVENTRPAATFAWDPEDDDFKIGEEVAPTARNSLVDSSQTLTVTDPKRRHHGISLKCIASITTSESVQPVTKAVQINVLGKWKYSSWECS